MAGTESKVHFQHDYILIRINEMKNDTGFRNLATTAILERVCKERSRESHSFDHGWSWRDFVNVLLNANGLWISFSFIAAITVGEC